MMPEVNRLMTAWMAGSLGLTHSEATALRKRYWHRYGATLLGLMRHHGVNAEVFLRETHPLGHLDQHVRVVTGLRARIQRLKGRRWLLTNAPRAYAQGLIEILGLKGCFERVIAIEDMRAMGQLRPKPSAWLWRHLGRQAGLPAHRLQLVDDSTENLRAAHRADCARPGFGVRDSAAPGLGTGSTLRRKASQFCAPSSKLAGRFGLAWPIQVGGRMSELVESELVEAPARKRPRPGERRIQILQAIAAMLEEVSLNA